MSKSNLKETNIVIVGGGTAGWLTATILATRNKPLGGAINITLVEAPDIPIVGVGEGTWPSMRRVLHGAGISERDFLKECAASFKQGSRFAGWKTGQDNDVYHHPFNLPEGFDHVNLAQHWLMNETQKSFSDYACPAEHLSEQGLSPKLLTSRDYAGATNYGYHLDAGKFSEFLKRHCTKKMGVKLILDRMTAVKGQNNGDIKSIALKDNPDLQGDLFIDCTGFRSLLLGQHYGIDFIDKSDVFPIDTALAVHVPHGDRGIKSTTWSTAQTAGWIWDISLSNRDGVGYVYSSSHIEDDEAFTQLQTYLGLGDKEFADISPRKISFKSGYRPQAWKNNCVAIGLSAGFLEPLEATAMMLIEASANMVVDVLQAGSDNLSKAAEKFNSDLSERWACIMDFLKLHYVLTQRQETFWRDASGMDTVSDRLKSDLELWSSNALWNDITLGGNEVFPAASYQYVFYGMAASMKPKLTAKNLGDSVAADKAVSAVERRKKILEGNLISNRQALTF